MIRLYTIPPSRDVEWPWLLLNLYSWKRQLPRGARPEHALFDSAVTKWFFVDGRRDYPPEFLEKYGALAQAVSKKYDCFVTIPDYPDDYKPGLCWKGGKDNVERTFENIERFSKVDGVEWLYPIQSRYLDFESFRESCRRLREEYNPRVVGIASVCKTRKLKFIVECAREARRWFPNAWIHAFGPTLKAIRYIHFYIDSFDSLAFFFKPRWLEASGDKRMCKTRRERTAYFWAWVRRLEEIVSKPNLAWWLGNVDGLPGLREVR